MRIETGHPVTKDVKSVDADRVRFIAADGQAMFEVTVGKDGRSIEVRAVECCKVDGVLYGSAMVIHPNVSNSITIRTEKYDR